MWRLTTNLPKKGGFAAGHYVGVRRQANNGGVRRRCFTNFNNNATAVMRSSSSLTSSSSIINNNIPSLISPSTSRQHQHRGQSFRFFATDNDDSEKGKDTKTTWDLDDIDLNDPDDIPHYDDDDDDFEIGDMFAGSGSAGGDDINQTEEDDEERERYRIAQEVINAELDSRTGRPWQDPWHISEEQWMSSNTTQENLADWSPDFVSRVSLERIHILESKFSHVLVLYACFKLLAVCSKFVPSLFKTTGNMMRGHTHTNVVKTLPIMCLPHFSFY
jgi:hypothetical protein